MLKTFLPIQGMEKDVVEPTLYHVRGADIEIKGSPIP